MLTSLANQISLFQGESQNALTAEEERSLDNQAAVSALSQQSDGQGVGQVDVERVGGAVVG